MKNKLNLICCILVVGIIVAIPTYLYFPVKLNVELVSISDIAEMETLSNWKTICDENDKLLVTLADSGVEVPDFDFENYNLIVSQGKEIESITYKRISRFRHERTDNKPYIGEAKFKGTNEKTIYFYKIEKIDVVYDVWTEGV